MQLGFYSLIDLLLAVLVIPASMTVIIKFDSNVSAAFHNNDDGNDPSDPSEHIFFKWDLCSL